MIDVLSSSDPEVFELCRAEERRQADKIRLIPSENYVSGAVLAASGSVFTNKYSEGYPGKRYYEGQEFVDPLEQLAIDRAKALFGADARQRPALLGLAGQPGRLPRLSQAGRQGDGAGAADGRPPDPRLERLDHRQVLHARSSTASARTPGASTMTRCASWPRRSAPPCCGPAAPPTRALWDFETMASIAREVGARFCADIAHIAGLVAGGVHPSPSPTPTW